MRELSFLDRLLLFEIYYLYIPKEARMEGFEKYARKILLYAGVTAVGIVVLVLFFKYLLGACMPFLLAGLLSAIVAPLCKKLKKKTGISYRLWCIILLLLLTLLLTALLWVVLSGVVRELTHLVKNEESVMQKLSSAYNEILSVMSRRLPRLYERLQQMEIEDRILSYVSDLSLRASVRLAKMAFTLPEVMLFVVVTCFAAYYFSADSFSISRAFFDILPQSMAGGVSSFFVSVFCAVKNYFKAGGLLLLITFGELLAGFFVLRVDFPVLLSMVIAAVDFLPVLGTGTILLPWALVLCLIGNYKKGIGLVMLWGLTLVVRQLAEPKIMGKSLGIHPLLTLFSTYFGLKLFGIGGLLLLPILTSILVSVWRDRGKYKLNNNKFG